MRNVGGIVVGNISPGSWHSDAEVGGVITVYGIMGEMVATRLVGLAWGPCFKRVQV